MNGLNQNSVMPIFLNDQYYPWQSMNLYKILSFKSSKFCNTHLIQIL